MTEEGHVALKDLKATDKDRLAAKDRKIDDMRELLRDVYDVASAGKPLSSGLLARIRVHAAFGRN
jgi:hypothetical protein